MFRASWVPGEEERLAVFVRCLLELVSRIAACLAIVCSLLSPCNRIPLIVERGLTPHYKAGVSASVPEEGNASPLQCSWRVLQCLENSVDRGTWWAKVHEVAKSRARLSNRPTHSLLGRWGGPSKVCGSRWARGGFWGTAL